MWLIGILIGLFVLSAPIVAIVAIFRTSDLRMDLARLSREIAGLRTELTSRRDAAGEAEPESPAIPEPAAPPEAVYREPVEEEPVAEEQTAPVARQAMEEKFASRWLPWLGGGTVVLAVVFLVKYSVDMGWLGPAARCLLGALLGVATIGAGEWLRRSPLQRAIAVVQAPQTPPVLTGAGVSMLFVSIYAAYGLYGLMPPLVAFAMLAAVWTAAVLLSLLHGPYVAALGILGGFAVPILVQTGHPSAYALFPYLTAVTAAALAVVRHKGWGWLAWGTLAGAAVWPILWFDAPGAALEAPAVGGYLLVTAILFTYVPSGLKPHAKQVAHPEYLLALPYPARLAWAAAAAVVVLVLLLAEMDEYGLAPAITLGAIGAFFMAAGRRDETYDGLAAMAAAGAALMLLVWRLPAWPGDVDVLSTLPPGLLPFASACIGFAVLFGAGGFGLLWGAARPGLWAAVSAGMPVAALAIAYGRIQGFEVDFGWAVAGLGLAGVNLVAAEIEIHRRGKAGSPGALAAYAVGVVAAVTLAMTMALENAWLTVALALQLPALALIDGRLKLPALRILAYIVASVVLIRLVGNYQLFDYRLGATPGLNWMLYGYGLPMLAFYLAARLFRRTADDLLVTVLEGGALVFLVILITLEIADIVHGGRFLPGYDLLEVSLRAIGWLAVAWGLLRRLRHGKRLVPFWGWRILAGLAAAQIIVLHVLAMNPLVNYERVGDWPIVNLMLLAYGVPALFALLFRLEAQHQGLKQIADFAGLAVLVLLFVELSLEVRHAFHPVFMNSGFVSNAEWYAYSAAWLAYAGLLLALGIWRVNKPLRYASLAVLMLTVGKVFLFDMAALDGLYRVVSFLGLGLCLMLIGLLYQRFVFPPGREPAPEPQPAS